MTTSQLIALAGVARAGKDDLAAPLINAGYKRFAFGDVIKAFFRELIAGEIGLYEVQQKMLAANPYLTPDQLDVFLQDVLLPFWKADLCCDAFTENDAEKRVVRPVLEHGGDLIYDHVKRTYFAEIDAALERGERVINPRLVRVPEAVEWRARGGELILIDCVHVEAVSKWEKECLIELKRSGHITQILPNWGTAEEWQAKSREFAQRAS